MSGVWIEPIEPPTIGLAAFGEEPFPECDCDYRHTGFLETARAYRNFYRPPVPKEPAFNVVEGFAAAAPQPKLWLSLLHTDVASLNNALMRDASWDVWHAFGVMAWIYERVASIRLRVVVSKPSFRMRVVEPSQPSAMLGTPWSPNALIQIALAVGRNSPWGLGTFVQVFTHELCHWFGSIYGAFSPDWHTSERADLMCRAPARRTMWAKYDATEGVYYGLSYRELEWMRVRLGAPLVVT